MKELSARTSTMWNHSALVEVYAVSATSGVLTHRHSRNVLRSLLELVDLGKSKPTLIQVHRKTRIGLNLPRLKSFSSGHMLRLAPPQHLAHASPEICQMTCALCQYIRLRFEIYKKIFLSKSSHGLSTARLIGIQSNLFSESQQSLGRLNKA